MKQDKFIVTDGTAELIIGGFGNDLGNKELFKYSEKEIEELIINNNHFVDDDVRLVNSLLRTIRNQDNIIKEAIEYIESYMPNYDFDKTNLIKLLEILNKAEEK